mmetsp:Transcript_35371/g.64868  ORF Transcript_35371/g.64868 Transcript_35371/m.64868 type:complete len:231 (-) Transcript_35371:1652-2344(-)
MMMDEPQRSSPTVERSPMKSITVAAAKEKGGGGPGGAKYCYGCGATIVKRSQQESQTVEAKGGGIVKSDGSNSRDNSGGGNRNNVSMGLKSSAGGYWNEQKLELQISQIKNWGYCPRCRALQKCNTPKIASSTTTADAPTICHHQLEALSPSHEMTQLFRDQVSKIRSKPNAVVILCVDAVNPGGSLINTLRKYVGGNPILLAVTRCDLLPEYVMGDWSRNKKEGMEGFF